MLCLSCLQRRLGRPLRPDDFLSEPINTRIPELLAQLPAIEDSSGAVFSQPTEEQDDSPMGWDDYGIIDTLTAEMLSHIDAEILSQASATPKSVAKVITHIISHSPAHVSGVGDMFYLNRVGLLVESGALVFVGDLNNPMKGRVSLPPFG
jgi:hypothetical protein